MPAPHATQFFNAAGVLGGIGWPCVPAELPPSTEASCEVDAERIPLGCVPVLSPWCEPLTPSNASIGCAEAKVPNSSFAMEGREGTTRVPVSGFSRPWAVSSTSGRGGSLDGCALVNLEPHSRQKLAPCGLSTPHAAQLALTGVAGRLGDPSTTPRGGEARSGSRRTEPQSRQYLTWLGLLRPHRAHSTGGGDRVPRLESSPNPMELRRLRRYRSTCMGRGYKWGRAVAQGGLKRARGFLAVGFSIDQIQS